MEKATENTDDVLTPGVYLFPVMLSEGDPERVLPTYNLHIIKQIRHFVVENVRTARRFLKRMDRTIDVGSLEFVELSEHTSDAEIPSMLAPVLQGYPLGVMSEAGCPAVADPGAKLVEYAQMKNIRVIPLVGPSSILLALMGSGMNGQHFTFDGYLPVDDKGRETALRGIVSDITRNNCTHLFIETPYRNNRLLAKILSTVPGHLKLCVACDVTGADESITTRTVSEWKKTEIDYAKRPAIFVLGR